jgi:hypothetical protein
MNATKARNNVRDLLCSKNVFVLYKKMKQILFVYTVITREFRKYKYKYKISFPFSSVLLTHNIYCTVRFMQILYVTVHKDLPSIGKGKFVQT